MIIPGLWEKYNGGLPVEQYHPKYGTIRTEDEADEIDIVEVTAYQAQCVCGDSGPVESEPTLARDWAAQHECKGARQ